MAKQKSEAPSTGDQVNELKTMVVGYAKQETVDPLKSLGRYVGFGAAGGICIGLGALLLTMSLLRGLQSIDAINEPGRVHGGTWSWVPYLGALALMAVIAGMAAAAAKRGGDDRRS
ncbi:MAG: phage holin family protein [Microthrixaceae bacterium]|nr:phage holin family protein [Microthrixaceae bacterium]